jgi:hypothetical protein
VGDSKPFDEIDRVLSELGKSEDEVTEVLERFSGGTFGDLASLDAELDGLTNGAAPRAGLTNGPSQLRVSSELVSSKADAWDGDNTEVEVLDMDDDFVLLVDEDVLQSAEEDDVAQPVVDPDAAAGRSDPDSSIFKKLFKGRKDSSRPQS